MWPFLPLFYGSKHSLELRVVSYLQWTHSLTSVYSCTCVWKRECSYHSRRRKRVTTIMLACLWEPKCQKDILSNCHINCLVFLNCHISYWPHTCRTPPLFQRCIFLWPQERSKANSKIDCTLKFPCHSTPSTIQQSFNNPLVTLSLCQRFHESSGNKLQCSYLTWQSSVGRQVTFFVPSSCFPA